MTARPFPLFFRRAEGVHLWDVDGNRYLDFLLGQGPMFLGHGHPAVVDAVTRAARSGQLFAGQHPDEVELAELIAEVVPCAEQVRLCSSGSEAVHAALRLVRAATGRARVVKFEGHYHGWFDDVLVSVTPAKLGRDGERSPIRETAGQVVPGADEVSVVPWNNLDAVMDELHRGDVAAILMEPIAANHSVIPPEPGFLKGVRDACDRTGTVLLFDEIITGFRLGLGGAQARLGVTPDLAVFGKAMASGFPIACVAGRAALFEGISDGRIMHAGTFNANGTSVAAALATIRTLRSHPDIHQAAVQAGRRIIDGLNSLAIDDLVVQGLPELLWMGFGEGPVRSARDLVAFDEARIADVSGVMVRRGFYVAARGTWYLSGLHTTSHADLAVEAFDEATREVSRAFA